ncbi:MAG: DEAD/DEAH box helicase [Candidatus Woesearchaeota archaeon]|nr:MAG: DEAD/DEAH box helicase [Candidatus Woesearchaeota archaeon]
MASFKELGLKKDVQEILSQLAYQEPTLIQQKIIPLLLTGENLLFTSKTGSGKTLAFLLGFLNKINPKVGIQMMVVVPTRELAVQICKECERIGDALGIKVGVLHGGKEIVKDKKTITKKTHIMIGTPGRLVQHINAKSIKVGDVRYLVFDESDQMFDNGFFKECVYLRSRVSKEAQIVLSSATISNRVTEFMNLLPSYDVQTIGEQIPKNIVQEYIRSPIKEKNEKLLKFLKTKKYDRAMMFCNRKDRAEELANIFPHAKALHGDVKQTQRTNLLSQFKHGKIKVLITTDVAARGLHIESVDMIINYDVSRQPEFYVHRMGRTGRNDKKGYVLTLVCEEDQEHFDEIIERYNLKIKEILIA